MLLFKYLWIVILVVYLTALSLYTYFAFQEATKFLRDHSSEEYNSKYTTMDVIEEVLTDHEGLVILWAVTLVILFLASIIVYGVTNYEGGG